MVQLALGDPKDPELQTPPEPDPPAPDPEEAKKKQQKKKMGKLNNPFVATGAVVALATAIGLAVEEATDDDDDSASPSAP
jgi:hypothetical protein